MMSKSLEEPPRGMFRGFARWLLISVPLVPLELATRAGTSFVLGAIALHVAGVHFNLRIALWRYLR